MSEIIEKLSRNRDLSDDEFRTLITSDDPILAEELRAHSDAVRRENYGTAVFLRALIEISNCCVNNCLYCGIRRGSTDLKRYRLNTEDILMCCETAYQLGLRTFVLQSGEDAAFTDSYMCALIAKIRTGFPDCAITLSIGERSYESYKRMRDAGADRYLLRHEAADEELYSRLHPSEMSLENRKNCLRNLKKLGYQTGAGFMVGAPFQTTDHLIADLRFLQEIQPEMIGIGPFIPHRSTVFANENKGSLALTLKMLGIIRLMFPKALIPATTALASSDPRGRELGLKTGANVVMPNVSPLSVRKQYDLYDNKLSGGAEASEGLESLYKKITEAGYTVSQERGDALKDPEIEAVKFKGNTAQ